MDKIKSSFKAKEKCLKLIIIFRYFKKIIEYYPAAFFFKKIHLIKLIDESSLDELTETLEYISRTTDREIKMKAYEKGIKVENIS